MREQSSPSWGALASGSSPEPIQRGAGPSINQSLMSSTLPHSEDLRVRWKTLKCLLSLAVRVVVTWFMCFCGVEAGLLLSPGAEAPPARVASLKTAGSFARLHRALIASGPSEPNLDVVQTEPSSSFLQRMLKAFRLFFQASEVAVRLQAQAALRMAPPSIAVFPLTILFQRSCFIITIKLPLSVLHQSYVLICIFFYCRQRESGPDGNGRKCKSKLIITSLWLRLCVSN